MKTAYDHISLKKLERKNFNFLVSSFADMWNEHIMINGKIFLVKRINEYGDACLCKVTDDANENIGNLYCCGLKKNYFEIHFIYNGFSCRQRIKYTDVRKTID